MDMFKRQGKKGAQGIGTLIIFIALILVASVAAGVVLQTGSSLQSKATSVGSQTQNIITTFIKVDTVYSNGTQDGQIDALNDTVTATLRAGTEVSDINLETTSVQVFTTQGVQTLSYSGNSSYSTSEFGVEYISNGGNPKLNGFLTSEDIASMKFIPIYNMTSSEPITIKFSPRDGQALAVKFFVPGSLTDPLTVLYP